MSRFLRGGKRERPDGPRPASGSIYEARRLSGPEDAGDAGWRPVGEIEIGTGRFTPDPSWNGRLDGWQPLGQYLGDRRRL
jgi:hypothetical protein